jgi:hypothetical protein
MNRRLRAHPLTLATTTAFPVCFRKISLMHWATTAQTTGKPCSHGLGVVHMANLITVRSVTLFGWYTRPGVQ